MLNGGTRCSRPVANTTRAARAVSAGGAKSLIWSTSPCGIAACWALASLVAACTISNVPGPNVPVYLCGARLIAHYPVSVVTDGQGLNITLVGYLGQLHFGLVACRELVPDIDMLAGYLVDELAVLAQAADKHAAG